MNLLVPLPLAFLHHSVRLNDEFLSTMDVSAYALAIIKPVSHNSTQHRARRTPMVATYVASERSSEAPHRAYFGAVSWKLRLCLPVTYNCIPIEDNSSNLLLVLASTIILGFGTHDHIFLFVPRPLWSRNSAVGIATGYGLDDRGVRVRVPVGSRIFASSRRPYRLWGPHGLLSNEYRGFFPRGKAAGA
jgi:hypothetical protein